jgi:predicted metal-dependent enzyme (double-stranded beta helix superfamily)
MSMRLAPLPTEILADIVRDHLDDPDRWSHLVHHDADQRQYELLHRDGNLEVWLVCWMPGHDTGFHDHDASAAAVGVAGGAVSEQRLAVGRPPMETEYSLGEVVTIAPSAIHRVLHAGGAPAVTIHAYSPPLGRMGQYEIAADGTLQRFAQDADEELKAVA